ncbi:hypothetical protein [Tateyamaria pelophila]|uniref:hypothetical protein n=1 Tax=Tateyamaria pelophila TaxID=328415 RepID=UPI001CBD3547|nr:hypothetical protein [Tateyamaria pelophila]
MNNNQAMVGCALGSWLVAAFAGALAAVLLMVLGGWSFLQAAFIGAVVFAAAGVLISVIMCRPLPPLGGASEITDNSAPSAAQRAAASESTRSGVQSSKPMPGQDDLAARKGEWKYESKAAAAPATPKTKPAAPANDGPGTKPQTLEAAREDGPDNLKQIKGVGPKLEGVLHSMGFYHFDQIASWGADEIAWVDENLEGFKGRVSRDNWVEQAKTLAEGGTTEFSAKVKKGGVY